jgi:hypothetical protein
MFKIISKMFEVRSIDAGSLEEMSMFPFFQQVLRQLAVLEF